MLQPELPLPHFIERGRDTTITCPLYDGGTLYAPSSGTVEITDGEGAVIASGPIVVSASVASFVVLGADTAAASLSDSWIVVWSIDSETPVRNDAFLVRHVLPVSISTKAITERLPLLNGSDSSMTSRTDWSGIVNQAWVDVQLRLIELGRRPELVLQPSALRTVTLLRALQYAFEDLGTRAQDDGALFERSKDYEERYQSAWQNVKLKYDADNDGIADDASSDIGGTVWLY